MTAQSASKPGEALAAPASWLPMVVIAMAQFLISFNGAALPMSIGPMVATFKTPPTTVGTAIVVYALMIAAFVMLGARIGQLVGSKRVFQAMVIVFGAAMLLVSLSPTATIMVAAEGLAGAAASALVPTLVVLIAANFTGRQQQKALGFLGSAAAFAGVMGFLVAGVLGTLSTWRHAFALLIPLAAAIFGLSFKLRPVARKSTISIDVVGVLLAAGSVILMSVGLNRLSHWGLLWSTPNAPFDLFGLSPAPPVVIVGIVLGQTFLQWSQRRQSAQKTPLLALEVLGSRQERSAVISLFIMVVLSACINFLVPLYIMTIQGQTSLRTGLSMIPYNSSIFFSAVLVVKLFDRWTPRRIAHRAFALVAVGMLWLAAVIHNEWSTPPIIAGLIAVGLGQGALVTLLFNVLVTASPKEFAGDVGALRGTTNNLATAVGTAFASALAIGLLSAAVMRHINDNPLIPAELQAEVDLDSINFVSNDHLMEIMGRTTATPEQVVEAVRINTDARLQALKISFSVFSVLALLAIFPSGHLTDYIPPDDIPGEVPSG